MNKALGPVMCDVAGTCLTESEREILCHPLVGGVILFSRNFESVEQLKALCAEIRALRKPALLIAVDHEGGRVQRFRQGFTHLPPMRTLGDLWDRDPQRATLMARQTGQVLAGELLDCGVSLSFTPVLDLDYGQSKVVGDRAFHRDPEVVHALAFALTEGLRASGMGSVGKHFPGHGFAEADSHVAIPRDSRCFEAIWAEDMQPYAGPLGQTLSGIMPAHVIYEKIDARPAGFSPFWLKEMLRGRLGFQGAIFSDDLTMEGASVAGDILARAQAAREAGCDMVLVCNRPDMVADLLARWDVVPDEESSCRIQGLQAQGARDAWLLAREDLKAWMQELA